MNEVRKLTKKGNNSYELEVSKNDRKIVTTVKFSKSEMKNNVESVKRDLNVAMARKHQLETQIKKVDVEDTSKLRDMIELIKKAQALDGKTKLETDLKTLLVEIDNINNQHKELKRVCPEFFR